MIKRSVFLALSWGTFSMMPGAAADLPPQVLPVYGGSGGVAFGRTCYPGQVLTGFRYRKGFWLDAIGLLCRPVNANGTLGPETSVGSMAGGGGGTSGSVSCPVASAMSSVTISFGSFVQGMTFKCRTWFADTRSFGAKDPFNRVFGDWASTPMERAECEDIHQPVHGIRGRSASYLDAIGIVCDEP